MQKPLFCSDNAWQKIWFLNFIPDKNWTAPKKKHFDGNNIKILLTKANVFCWSYKFIEEI